MTIKVENLMEAYPTYRLTAAEIAWLVEETGAGVGAASPLEDVRPGKESGGKALALDGLRRKGLLSGTEPAVMREGLPEAVRALADPVWTVTLRTGSWKGVSVARFVGRNCLRDGSLVHYRRHEDGGIDISFFLSKEHVLALIEPDVRLQSLTIALPQRFGLTYEAYAVFVAIADAYRQAHLESLLQRSILEDWAFAPEDIESALYKGLAYLDPRWLVSIARISLPFPYEWRTDAFRRGMDDLVQGGLLLPAGGGAGPSYRPAADLEVFCGSTMGIEGFATVEVDEIAGDQRRGVLCLNLVRVPGTVWLTGFNNLAGGAPEATVFSAEGFFACQAIAELLERLGSAGAGGQKPEPPPAPRYCANCGARLKTGAKFCTACGTGIGRRPRAGEGVP